MMPASSHLVTTISEKCQLKFLKCSLKYIINSLITKIATKKSYKTYIKIIKH